MSYEGYEQYLCSNGHLHEEDAHVTIWSDPLMVCSICHEPFVWKNSVDETNGSHDEETGERIDGQVELEVLKEVKFCVCPICKTMHALNMIRYKIPTSTGHRIPSQPPKENPNKSQESPSVV